MSIVRSFISKDLFFSPSLYFLLSSVIILLLYYGATHVPENRILVEGIMVIIAFFMLDKKSFLILGLLALLSLVHWKIFEDILWNIATISLIIYSSKKKLITASNLLLLTKNIVIILVVFVVFNEITDFKIEIFKNGGPFPSSLHLSYVLVTLSLIIYLDKSPTAHIFLFVIFCMAILNGSRTSFIFSGILLLLTLKELPIKLQFFYALAAIVFFIAFSIRSIGFELGNDDVRINGYLRYLDNLTVTNFIFGEGRASYGSIGIRVNGKENVFISESSIIMLLYCHGAILTFLILKPIFIKLYFIGTSSRRNIVPVFLMFGIFITIPFFDSLGIGVINAFFLNQFFLNSYET